MNLLKKISECKKFENIKVNTEVSGLVRGLEGNIVETDGFPASVGSVCEIESLDEYNSEALTLAPNIHPGRYRVHLASQRMSLPNVRSWCRATALGW